MFHYPRLAGRAIAAAAMSLVLVPAASHAQGYPNKPIRLVIGYSPAGAADFIARIVGEAMSKELGQPVLVDNKPGAGSTLASTLLAQAPADGYTLGLATATIYGIDQLLYKTKYTPDSFTPVTRLTVSPLILAVNKDLGVGDIKALAAKAKANPGKYNYSSSGVGGSPHVAALTFEKAMGVQMTHVPYKGGAPALQAVAAGDVELSFGTAASVLPLGNQGVVKMLGVTSPQRSAVAPGLPALAEQGLPGFEFTFWFGLFGPGGMPKEVTDKLFAVATKVLADPNVRARLVANGNEAAPSPSPREFGQWASADGIRARDRVVQAGVKLD
jgi:tripartite-type tricarboxylate transporter receptor subunit TctC